MRHETGSQEKCNYHSPNLRDICGMEIKGWEGLQQNGVRTPFPQPTAGLGSSVLRGTGKATNAWRFE